MTTSARIISANHQAFEIMFSTLFIPLWSQNIFSTNRGASWNPSVPPTFNITYFSRPSFRNHLSCHSIKLLFVGYRLAGLKFPPWWRPLRILDIICFCEVWFNFYATNISLHFMSSAKYFLFFESILILFKDVLAKNSTISVFQGRKLNICGCWILFYC